jgi:hypothetical protein
MHNGASAEGGGEEQTAWIWTLPPHPIPLPVKNVEREQSEFAARIDAISPEPTLYVGMTAVPGKRRIAPPRSERMLLPGDAFMSWSINIGTITGTAVRIHITFVLFLGWIFTSETIGEMLMVYEALPKGARLRPWSRPFG